MRILLICILSFSLIGAGLLGSQKVAYKHHYQGTLQYAKGSFKKANAHFQKAYRIAPDNFNFALSYALSLGRTGKASEAMTLLKKREKNLIAKDPQYRQKVSIARFTEGMVQTNAGLFNSAVSSFKKSIELQKKLGHPKLLSIYINALGYATLMDQGSSSHSRGGLGKHYHIHERDMQKAVKYFQLALDENTRNNAALHNYHLLCNALELTPETAFENRASKVMDISEAAAYSFLPYNAAESISFSNYDEVVLLLDISGSMVMEKVACMGTTRFEVMKEMVMYALDKKKENTRFAIGTIGGDCGTTPRLWHPAGTLTDSDLRWAIKFLTPDGTTPLLGMLKESPELFSDSTDTQKAIFLISDGANVCRESGLDICGWADDLSKQKITINILTFLDAQLNNANAFAEYGCLAYNTNGKILYLDNNRCNLEYFSFKMVEESMLFLPEMQKTDCLNANVKNAWAIFPEGGN